MRFTSSADLDEWYCSMAAAAQIRSCCVQIEDEWALEVLAQHAAHTGARHLSRYTSMWRAAVLAQQAARQQLSMRLHRVRMRSLFQVWLERAHLRHTLRIRFAAWRCNAASAHSKRVRNRAAADHHRRSLSANAFRAWVIVWCWHATARALQARRAARITQETFRTWRACASAGAVTRQAARACAERFTGRIAGVWRRAAAREAAVALLRGDAHYQTSLQRRGLQGLVRAVWMRDLLRVADRWHADRGVLQCLRKWAKRARLQRSLKRLAAQTQRAACAMAFCHWYWSTSGQASALRFQVRLLPYIDHGYKWLLILSVLHASVLHAARPSAVLPAPVSFYTRIRSDEEMLQNCRDHHWLWSAVYIWGRVPLLHKWQLRYPSEVPCM
jgi:hypothetical protein